MIKHLAQSRWLFPLGGLVVGFVLAIVLPASWIYVDAKPVEEMPDIGGGYACPMFCTVMKELPANGQCPVCGMEMGPIAADAALTPHERGMIGLEASHVDEVPLVKELLLTGEVDYDETRITTITARTKGWIESLSKKVTWENVEKNELLFELYGPELYSAQQEYLVAKKSRDAQVLDAAIEHLHILGVGPAEIAVIDKAKRPLRSISFRSPRAGVIVRRGVSEGDAVKVGDEIFAIADLSRVWLQMDVFETDLLWLFVGGSVTIRPEIGRDRRYDGTIIFIDPVVGRMSRTARVRIEIANTKRERGSWEFAPGQRMTASASIPLDKTGVPRASSSSAEPTLALPRSSILRTGKRAVVFVLYEEDAQGRKYDLDPNRLSSRVGYEMVEVELGPLTRRADREVIEEFYPLRRVVPRALMSGKPTVEELKKGMIVATKGALLLDSQAQLSGRPSLLFPEGRSVPAGDHAHSHH